MAAHGLSKVYKNFKEYSPEVRPENAPDDARFFSCDSGEDWYDLMYKFSSKQWTVGFDAKGQVIWAVRNAAGTVSPAGLSVAVVDTLPTGKERERDDYWAFVNGEVVNVGIEYFMPFELQKTSRMSKVESRIRLLERKVKLNLANAAEIDLLERLEIYSIKVASAVNGPEFSWPIEPQ